MGNETSARPVRAQAVGIASAALAAAGILLLGATDEPAIEHVTFEPEALSASVPGRIDRSRVTAVLRTRDEPRLVDHGSSTMVVTSAVEAVESQEAEPAPTEPVAKDPVQRRTPTAEADRRVLPSSPHQPDQLREEAVSADRGRMSPANVRAREIAIDVSRSAAATAVSAPGVAALVQGTLSNEASVGGGGWIPESDSGAAVGSTSALDQERWSPSTGSALGRPRKVTVLREPDNVDADEPAPRISSSEVLESGVRHLMFVWDSSIVLDETRSDELLAFADSQGFNTLAIEATGVGYHDAALTAAFARFTEDASDAGIQTFALIGYPWFTVAPHAGLPGQPTSSLEGVAILETIVQTNLFDGVVDDSHPYGVEYEIDGETRNWLFDEPAAAGVDLQAWLRSAKEAVGDLPLVKTTPFWFDSHEALQDIVDLDGQGFLSLAHLIAREVDATAVLAYRDEFTGPNGILELVAGELAMGPAIVTLETGDLGANLDYLTFHEEGLHALDDMLAHLSDQLGSFWAFTGTGVHHYVPLKAMVDELMGVESFGFVGVESITAQNSALVDAYDSSLGRYYDQMGYNDAIGVVAGLGLGAIVSNGDITLNSGALVFGDARAGVGASVTEHYGVTVTGTAQTLSSTLVIPDVDDVDVGNADKLDIDWNREGRIAGDGYYDRIRLDGYASLTIEGPANIVVDELRLGNYAYIYADPTNGPVTITVNKRIDLADYAWIAPTTLQARDLTIRYAGNRRISMNYGSRLLGDVLAPNAEIRVGNAAEIYGRARAKSLDLQYASELHLDIDLLRVLPQ